MTYTVKIKTITKRIVTYINSEDVQQLEHDLIQLLFKQYGLYSYTISEPTPTGPKEVAWCEVRNDMFESIRSAV